MTEQELRKKIFCLLEAATDERYRLRLPMTDCAAQILTLIEEAGFIQLAEDQSWDDPNEHLSHKTPSPNWVTKAGWRKVKITKPVMQQGGKDGNS